MGTTITHLSSKASRRWLTSNTRRGFLTTRQELTWHGWFDLCATERNVDRIRRLHFAAIERYAFGAIRCERAGDTVDCRVGGILVVLVFDQLSTISTERLVVCRWRLAGGMLARQPITGHPEARFEIGVRVSGPNTMRAWVEVTDFPSIFLTPSPFPPGRVADAIAAIYTTFHAHVSFAHLHVLRGWLESTAIQTRYRSP